MKKILSFIFLACILAASCTDNILPQAHLELEGRWALQQDMYLTDRYVEFRMGKCYTYIAAKKFYVSNSRVWGCSTDDFTLASVREYFFESGALVIGGVNVGPAEIRQDGMLRIGDSLYFPVNEFTEARSEWGAVKSVSLRYKGQPVHGGGTGEGTVIILERSGVDSLTAVVSPSDAIDKEIVWYSTAPENVSVDTEGHISAVSNGEAWIMAFSKYDYTVRDSCKVSVFTNLSVEGKANCYVVNEDGHYTFDVSSPGNSTDRTFSNIYSAIIVWKTFNTAVTPGEDDLVHNVKLDLEHQTVSFDVEFGSSNGGNAVIGVRDEKGTIVWSWHIWAVKGLDELSLIEIYTASSASDWTLVMDRNLGALSADPSAGAEALGLNYQWGRKDPFPCADGKLGTGIVATFNDPSAPWTTVCTDSSVGTVQYAAEHPCSFIKNPSGFDWLAGSASAEDVERWPLGKKSVYDPCPYGWRVPDNTLWQTAASAGSPYKSEIDASACGVFCRNFTTRGTDCWYPASGCISEDVSKVDYAGNMVMVHGAGISESRVTNGFQVDLPGLAYSYRQEINAFCACPVRCVLDY